MSGAGSEVVLAGALAQFSRYPPDTAFIFHCRIHTYDVYPRDIDTELRNRLSILDL